MTKKGCKCTYRYGGIEVEAQEFPPFMIELLRASMNYCGITNERDWPDSCNLNYYEDGGASVGWHADDESLFQGKHQDIRIVSLSFGQSRTFELRRNWPEGDELGVERIVLSNGDLMTMEGMTQKHFQHRVPKERCEGPRINLTWCLASKFFGFRVQGLGVQACGLGC
ncbi:Alkbh3 [Symbiodinium necroappetens]|uniref:Alkbh3 protein n=1 Tax=Symbiodinium necroappetens TaxID=1628268 RepID=A0A812J403_9DINO|nr:Alkbh3 [Symbiodinium necroappetens]